MFWEVVIVEGFISFYPFGTNLFERSSNFGAQKNMWPTPIIQLDNSQKDGVLFIHRGDYPIVYGYHKVF